MVCPVLGVQNLVDCTVSSHEVVRMTSTRQVAAPTSFTSRQRPKRAGQPAFSGVKNDEASFRTNPLGKLRVQPSLVINGFDGEGGWTKSKNSADNKSNCFLAESRC